MADDPEKCQTTKAKGGHRKYTWDGTKWNVEDHTTGGATCDDPPAADSKTEKGSILIRRCK